MGRADWKLKIVRITRYVRKRRGREYVEYKMVAPPGSRALFVPLTGRRLREAIGEFGRAYLLIVDPSDRVVDALATLVDSLGLGMDAVIVLEERGNALAKRGSP